MRVTIVGVNYAPEPTGIAPYTTGMARGLAARGHHVTVHTAFPHYPQWKVAPEYAGRGRVMENDGPVTVIRHPLKVDNGDAQGRIRMEIAFAARVSRASWRKPDVVLVVSPSLLSAAAVVARARLLRIPVGVIIQDLYGLGVVETRALPGPGVKAVVALERRLLNSADSVAVIHQRFSSQVESMGLPRNRIRVIRNWAHLDPSTFTHMAKNARAITRRAHGWGDGEIVVLHAGNMGAKQGLENVVSAASLAGNSCIRFVLLGDGNRRSALVDAARGIDKIQFIDPLPDHDFVNTLAAADILLVNELPDVGDMAVPSKLTTYAAAGRPVLAATRNDSVSASEVRAGEFGSVVMPGDPAALRDAAVRLGADAVSIRAMSEAGRRYATETLSEQTAIDNYNSWTVDLANRAITNG